jgi:hypothetical protein
MNMGTREKIAAGVSIVMIVAFIVYWVIQIEGAMEMLQQAYG